MVLEEFLVMLGANTETEKVKSFGAALTKVASIATVVVGALKTVTAAAWAFADSYVRKAEELYKSNSGLISVTKEQVEMSKKYQDGMKKLGDNIESVKVRIAFGFLPTMLKMVDSLNEFLAANKDLIVNGITRLLNIISYASQVVNNTVRFITKAIEATIGWKAALLILAGVFAFVKRAMLMAFITNPITWVVAALVGLMLLIDDFMTYLDGGDSLFGDYWGVMLEWIDKVKPALQAVWDTLVLGMSYLIQFGAFVGQYFGGALVDAVEVIVAALTMLYALFTGNTELMAAAWDGLVENMLSMFQNFASLFEPLAQMLVTIMSGVWDSIVSAIQERISLIIAAIQGFISSLGEVLSGVFDVVTAPFAQAFDWISNKFSSLGGLISGAVSGAGKLFGMGASAAASSTVNNGGSMTVNAPISVVSNDPNKAAKLVKTGVTDATNTAYRNMGSRVKA